MICLRMKKMLICEEPNGAELSFTPLPLNEGSSQALWAPWCRTRISKKPFEKKPCPSQMKVSINGGTRVAYGRLKSHHGLSGIVG